MREGSGGFEMETHLHAPLKVMRPQITSLGVTLSPPQGSGTRLQARRKQLEPFVAVLLSLDCPLTLDWATGVVRGLHPTG